MDRPLPAVQLEAQNPSAAIWIEKRSSGLGWSAHIPGVGGKAPTLSSAFLEPFQTHFQVGF